MNLMMLLQMAAEGFGDRVAFKNDDDQLTYAELYRSAGAAAAQLRESGAQHLAILDVSSLALPIGVFGSAWAGRPFVPLNYRLTGAELESLVGQIAPSRLVAESERVDALSSLAGTEVLARETFMAAARDAADAANQAFGEAPG